MSAERTTEPCETGCGARLPAEVEHTPIRCRTLRAIRAEAERTIPRADITVELEQGLAALPVYVLRVQWYDNDGDASRGVTRGASELELHTSPGAVGRYVHEVWERVVAAASELYETKNPPGAVSR